MYAIGASAVENPTRGSHYKVRFPGRRSWVLDRNEDPLKDTFIKELVPITGYPFEVIKSALLYGDLPARTLRLQRSSMITEECIKCGA